MKKVLMVIAKNGFRDEEFQVPFSALKENGFEVTVASSSLGEAKGVLGATVKVDTTIDKVNTADFDAVIFVGGGGSSEYFNNPLAHKIAQEVNAQGKLVAAICIAPVILANSGILKGKKATVWSSEADKFGIEELKRNGTNYTGRQVEIEGNIITANGPAAAENFVNAVMKKIRQG